MNRTQRAWRLFWTGVVCLALAPTLRAEQQTWTVAAADRDSWDDGTSGDINQAQFGDSTWLDAGGYQWAVTIPRGATILSADVSVYSDSHVGATGSAVTERIRVEDVDNAAVFSGAANDILGRTFWGTTVDWVVPAAGLPAGVYSTSPDISALIQHIVDRPGWAPGNYIHIAIWGQTAGGGRYEDINDTTNRVRLRVSYTRSGSNFRSIGAYSTGTASVAMGATTVTFAGGASLPADVQAGDQLVLDPSGVNETRTIASRDSATQVTLTAGAANTHAGVDYLLAWRQTAGTATIAQGSQTVSFSSALPTKVGVGDQLVIGTETFYVVDRVSANTVTVVQPAAASWTGAAYTLSRAFRTLSSWETARQGDLVAETRREIGVAYDDGPFDPPFTSANSALVINGSIANASYYMHLTVAEGHRHDGRAGTGVVVDGAGVTKFGIQIQDDYVRVDWLEMKGFKKAADSGFSSVVTIGTNALLDRLLVHDFREPTATGYGVRVSNTAGPWSMTVRNSILYDGDDAAIRLDEAVSTVLVQNCTVYGMESDGVSVGTGGGTLTATNTISMGNVGSGFLATGGTLNQSYNMSSDASATGTGSLPSRVAANQFVSLAAGSEDFHLIAGADALETGTDLSASFADDVDAEARPRGALWDIGADERASGATCPTEYRGWYDQTWPYRKAFVINSSKVSAVLTSFPVLVDLASDADLLANAQPDGDDLVFTAADGVTRLNHEIEKYCGAVGPGCPVANGALVAWVEAPRLSPGADAAIYMYYGNGTVGSQQNATGVWDASFKGVWHLKEDQAGVGTADLYRDSTANGHHADDQVSATGQAGQIDGGQEFDGTDDLTQVPDPGGAWDFGAGGLDAGTSDFTVSAWLLYDATATEGFPTLVFKGGGSNTNTGYWFAYEKSIDSLRMNLSDGVNRFIATPPTPPLGLTDGLWHHVQAVVDREPASDTVEFFVDGVSVGTDASALVAGNSLSGTDAVEFGGKSSGSLRPLQGNLDEVRISDVLRTASWIATEHANQSDPGTFYTVCGAATEVELVSFTASAGNGAVELAWETASELHNLGFHLYRGSSAEGPYERITASLIPGLGSSPTGARYGYRDAGLANGTTYYYQLEDVETTGRTERHGPVAATPWAGAAAPPAEEDPAPEDEAAAEPESWIRYGEPEASALRVLRSGSWGVDLELRTEGFYALPQPDGTVLLEVPGFVEVAAPGELALPVRRTWVDAQAGRAVALDRVRASGLERFAGLRPAQAEAVELEVRADGTIRAGRRRALQARWRGEGLHPEEAARLLETAFQGEVKKAYVELSPLRWDAAAGELLLARRVQMRLSFRGREDKERGLGGSRGRRRRDGGGRDPAGVVARLAAREAGLYAVRFEDVFPRRRQPVSDTELRLSRQGEAVAYHLEPDPQRFGPGSTLYFASPGGASNPHANEAVYELERGTPGLSMTIDRTSPSGAAPGFYWQRLDREQNAYYQAALLDAPQLWLWDRLFGATSKSYPFTVSGLAPSPEAGRVTVWLQGGSDTPADPDHHVRLRVNGQPVAEVSWNGARARVLEGELLPGLLVQGENLLELENVGDTGASYSVVYLDRFELSYPRGLAATQGVLEGEFSHSGAAEVAGLAPGAVALDVSDAQPRWLSGALATAGGLRFRVEAGHRYRAVSPAALLRPQIRLAAPVALRTPQRRADYLVVGPRELLPAAEPLLALRRDQGLAAEAVAIESVFDEFGYGEPRPEAIRDFLSYAYHEWQSPSPRYVVLLGDASFDPKNYAGTGVPNPVPALMFRSSYLWTASDPSLAAVNGTDALPDLAIGRLPASSLEEARAMVDKVVAWERASWSLDGPAVLVADNSDPGGDFEGDAEQAAALLPGREVEKLYLSRLGAAATRAAIRQAFDRGASLVSYLGHGALSLWASENLLSSRDVPALQPQPRQPLVLTMNCLNGYFLPPMTDSLSEELLAAPDRGAIAAFSPSGLSLHRAASRYHEALLSEIASGRHRRLGDALLAAQARYAETGALPELLALYHLFGDPALTIR